MNTTFTNYAEKKAKQFLNLLQGYTKGIRITAILILLLMGVSNAWAARTFKSGQKIYFKDAKDSNLNNSTWKVGGGNIYAYFWNDSENAWSTNGSLVSGSWDSENAIYEFTVPNSGKTYTKMLFTRGTAASWDKTWNQTGDQTPNDGQNIFYISSGTWGAYAKNGAIVGSMNNWNPDSNPLSSNTVTISLNYTTSKTYEFKVLYGETYYGTSTAISKTVSNQAFSTSGNNCTLNLVVASGAKNYIFTWDNSGKKLSVTYPTAYTVTYSRVPTAAANAPTTNPSVTSGSLVASGTSVTFTAQAAKNGYTWKGWYDNNAGTGNALSTNLAYTRSITANTNIYAVYTANTYTVKFDANGGSGNMSNQNFTYGTAQNLTANSFTKQYYTFKDWNTKENGSGTNYNDKQSVTNLSTINGDIITLYAQWTPEKYTITYKDQGDKTFSGKHNTGYPTQHTYNTITTLSEATKSGYTFEGWYRDSECAGERVETLGVDVTEDITLYAKWEVASYTITFDQQEGTGGTTSVTAQYGAKLSAITIPSRDGYLFDGYYTQTSGKGTKYYNADGTTTKTMPHNVSTLYAKWVPYAQCIFFKNNLKWNNVYVYTFNNEIWHNDKGVQPTVNRIEYGKMTQVGETDIYYYILTNLTGFSRIAFSEKDMHDYEFFYESKAIYRGDRSDQMPLFIPQTDQTATTTNKTEYYSSGIWMKYNSTESGYDWRGSTDPNDANQWSKSHSFTTDNPGGYSFKASVTFDNVNTHYFKIHNNKGDWYGNGGTMTQDNCTDWTFGTNNTENAQITPTIPGKYIFTVYLGDGEVKVSLDYPLSTEDYRLVYVDDVTGVHPGHYIKKRNEDRLDTVSFFVHHQNSPRILLQHCTAISNSGVPTWETDKEYQILKTGGADPTSAQLPGKRKSDAVLYTGEGCGIEESGVYNFVLQQSNSTADLQTDYTHPYVGDFYIRTDAAEGGWESFRQKSNQITYSSFADGQPNSNFNHYYCKYIKANQNVKFTIANDYSYCISDTLDNDLIIEEGQSSPGCLPVNANVRFGWDSNTNEISRAYIKGAGMTSDRFLVLQGQDNNLKDANGAVIPVGTGDRTGLLANEEILVDQQNWIYQVDVTANNQTFVKLIAEYNGKIQYFKGDDKEYTRLLSSTATDEYKIRLIYDFKSNHLVTAWLAGGTVQGEKVLGADMMVIREDQEQADQLNFNPLASPLKEVGTGYAVMTFTKDHITDNKKTERERSLYWVSFPFDVKVSDVFGFGEYAEHWILQYYDGAERAEKGLFSDSGTYWKYIFDTDTVLHAGEGYVLVLDLNKIEFLHGAEEVSLYFPSINPLTTISGELPTEATVPEHWCNIDREWTDPENGTTYHHKWTDSHWNLIGVPGFADITGFNVTENEFVATDPSFYYEFDLSRSKYNVTAGSTNFQAMYAYMVQFAGTIDWSLKSVDPVAPPAAIVARRYSDERPEKVVLRLELAQGEEVADRTFVQMQQEGATANFDLSLDLTKIVNIGVSNIYTLTDSLKIQVAGNALPMEETVVPVGVNIATAGEYTFLMPDGTEGMVVELIDYETNTRTNLLLSDYTVNLPTGSNETRFALSIKPEKTATNVGNIGGTMNDGQGVRKFIIDGKLYLQKDGMLYDAQGHIVR